MKFEELEKIETTASIEILYEVFNKNVETLNVFLLDIAKKTSTLQQNEKERVNDNN